MTTDIAKRKEQPLILQYLERHRDQIAAALPRHMTADRMARIVTTEVRKVPKLLKCDPRSLFGAVIQASQLGLEPGNALGHCYLIPFKQDVTLIIGYRGMIDLARRSGQIISIEARAVRQGDEFRYTFGLSPTLEHTPVAGPDAPLTHVYAVARLKDGGVQWDVMTVDEVNAIRDKSEGYRAFKAGKIAAHPWDGHPEEMSKKTVIRRLFKYLPVSVEFQRAIGLDEQADAGVDQGNRTVIEGDFMDLGAEDEAEPETRTDAVKDKLRRRQTPQDAPTYDEVTHMICVAQDADALALALDLAGRFPKQQAGELEDLVTTRLQQIEPA